MHGSHFSACTANLTIKEYSNQMVMKTKRFQMGLTRLHMPFQPNQNVHACVAANLLHAQPI